MSRPKLISDAAVLTIVRERLLRAGEKAVSFREVASATGLSAPALVLRFSSQPAMVSAALVAGWEELGKIAQTSGSSIGPSAKDVQDFLKLQFDVMDIPALLSHSLRGPAPRAAAAAYRDTIETILARRFGGGIKGRNTAGMVFAAACGRQIWADAGGKSFRFGEFLRDLD